jgi:hypothetical protein
MEKLNHFDGKLKAVSGNGLHMGEPVTDGLNLARFKAKYGVSNDMAAYLFQEHSRDVREWAMKGAPFHIEQAVGRIEGIIEHIRKEGELLGDHAPLIQVLKHDKEILNKSINEANNKILYLVDEISKVERMTFIQRLKFLFTSKIVKKQIFKEQIFVK